MNITKLFVLVLFFMTSFIGAQEISDHAFGLRLGDSDGFGAELSYQKSIGRYSRIEIDAGYRDSRKSDAFKATLLYQNVFELAGIFNWFYGFGGGAGNASFEPIPSANNPNIAMERNGGLFVFGAGNIGVEANLDMPLVISLDIRPEIGILGFKNFDNNFLFDVALGIRYQF